MIEPDEFTHFETMVIWITTTIVGIFALVGFAVIVAEMIERFS